MYLCFLIINFKFIKGLNYKIIYETVRHEIKVEKKLVVNISSKFKEIVLRNNLLKSTKKTGES